jgi:chromosome segregation ATPase
MFQVKLIIFILILGIAGGGYVYVQKLRADNATLKINTTKLETAVSQNEQTIKQQTEDFTKVRDTLSAVQEQKDALQGDKDNLEKKLQKHDLGQLAYNKPGLVVKIINKASDNANRCMEIASGSPLTEEELAATKKSQINGECPSLANPNYVLQ